MRMADFDAVVFDYGNTLISFEYPRAGLLATMESMRPRIQHALGRPAPTAEQLMDSVLLPLEQGLSDIGEDEIDYMTYCREGWHRAGLELDDGLLLEILDAEQRVWDRALQVVAGMPETLARLRRLGLKLGLCSNASFPPAMMLRQLDSNGIAELMDGVVFSSQIGKRKPSPVIYSTITSKLGVDPSRTLFVGDRVLEDYEGPIVFGMKAVICTAHARDDISAEVRTIASLEEIESLL